ncbi:MAG TPA: LysM peptidoglycan-binding domain-containing protein, partial [Mycobacteriales bacterium]|nr:LysM peptidoglycan-binding domain-containing protein [Mycobacteriales bacterium]
MTAGLQGLLALAALTGLLAGIPAVLVAVGADPLTVRLPTPDRVRQLLTSPDDGTRLIAVLRVVAWAGWGGLAISTVVETVATIAGWTVRPLRGLAAVQRPAAYLVAAVAAALTVPAAAPAAAPAAHTAAAGLPHPTPGFAGLGGDPHPSTAGGPPSAGATALAAATGAAASAGPPGRDAGPAPDPAAAGAGAGQPAHRLPTVRVGRYDSLWRIAERHLGGGRRWPEIHRLNIGRRQPDGQALTDPDLVEEGWTLLLPSDAVDADRPAAGDSRRREVVVVRPGDTLSGIAERRLGDAGDWPAIFAANTGRPQPDSSTLTDPDLIRPGWQLTLPTSASTRPGSPPGRSAAPVYEVVPGDRLGMIAERFLGHSSRHNEIAALNPALIRDDTGAGGPDHIEPGWRLILPADAHDAGPRPHAAGRVRLPPARRSSKSDRPADGPATPPAPRPPAPPPTGEPTAEPSPGGATPTPSPRTPAAAPAQPAPSGTGSPANADRARPDGGAELPGGWVSIPLAAAIAAAGGMVWLRRRHRYVPGPTARPVHDDPDLRPLPPAVAVLRRSVREQAPHLLDESAPPQPTVAEYAANGEPPDLPPIGPSGPDLAGLTGLIPAGGLGLAGPGAAPAARGLLVATLSSGGPADPDARGQVLIPAGTLMTLLGAETAQTAAQIGPSPR